MGLLYVLYPEEEGKECGHYFFDEIPSIPTKQEGLETSVTQIQHIEIKFNYDEIEDYSNRTTIILSQSKIWRRAAKELVETSV